MITICRSCLPRGWYAVPHDHLTYRHECAVCQKLKPAAQTGRVGGSVEHVRHTLWLQAYEMGPRDGGGR